MDFEIRELNHVAVHVKDLEKSIRFYEDIVGLKQIPRPDFGFPGAWFRVGDHHEFHLIAGRNNPVFSGNKGNHFSMEVDDLKKVEAWLHQKKISMLGPIDRPDGARQIFIEDPDGHYVEFTAYPPFH